LVFEQFENGRCHESVQYLVTTVLSVYCLFHSFILLCNYRTVYSDTRFLLESHGKVIIVSSALAGALISFGVGISDVSIVHACVCSLFCDQ
jgi:hypothetical protein